MSKGQPALRPRATEIPVTLRGEAGPPPARQHPWAHQAVWRRAYNKFDLDIPRGRLISIIDPNGCRKSTLINMVAGLIPVDAGEILFDGKLIHAIKFGYVFQNYREAFFPWLQAIVRDAGNVCKHLRRRSARLRTQSAVMSFAIKSKPDDIFANGSASASSGVNTASLPFSVKWKRALASLV